MRRKRSCSASLCPVDPSALRCRLLSAEEVVSGLLYLGRCCSRRESFDPRGCSAHASEADLQFHGCDRCSLTPAPNVQKLFGGLMFGRDTVGEAAKRRSIEPCSGATGRMQKPFCTRSTKSQATERPPNSFSTVQTCRPYTSIPLICTVFNDIPANWHSANRRLRSVVRGPIPTKL